MSRGIDYGLIFLLSLLCGTLPASGLDKPGERMGFAFASMPQAQAHAIVPNMSETRVPKEYAAAMTWYRLAIANGFDVPVIGSPWLHGNDLPEPLRWSWLTGSGDLITRVGRGAFRLSIERADANWFRDLDCRMVVWPGGDLQAKMECADGTERTMLIPEEGGLVLDGVTYHRAFALQPVDFGTAGLEEVESEE